MLTWTFKVLSSKLPTDPLKRRLIGEGLPSDWEGVLDYTSGKKREELYNVTHVDTKSIPLIFMDMGHSKPKGIVSIGGNRISTRTTSTIGGRASPL